MGELGLSARVAGRAGALSVDVALETGPGTLVVIGPNGAGKSSLLSLLLGARPVERGHVRLAGELLFDSDTGLDVPLEARRIGYVPQDYGLFPHLTVRENVAFGLASKRPALSRGERARRADRRLDELGLAGLEDRRPGDLSGGERQRVALARALAVEPRALLLDEPLAALDVHTRRAVRETLRATLGRLGLPTVLVTHDADDARHLGDGVLAIEAGRVTQRGTWAELSAAPATPFVASFVGAPARIDE